ncbi:MAG: hypothetical protein EON54_25480 [Alcaligenaceae bacterium]|nr:MAG: hypothetical protein EON54_25480 [Alcaligenaceae bacterium]
MNTPQNTSVSSADHQADIVDPQPWGHQHVQCKGEAAIAFFTADLARTIEMHLVGKDVDAAVLAQAQQAIDRLLAIYVGLQAAPYAFEGQTITLNVAMQERADGPPFPYVALTTSERLENLIIEMQERERMGLG